MQLQTFTTYLSSRPSIMPSTPASSSSSLPVIPYLRTYRPRYKKRVATIRFLFQRSPTSVLLLTVIIVLPFILAPMVIQYALPGLVNGARIQNNHNKTPLSGSRQLYVDPCSLATPEPLVHFDPSDRASREFASFLSKDVDPPSFNRIFSTFFNGYMFDPNSDVIINLNSTARGRPTEIHNALGYAESALQRYYQDPDLRVVNYTLGYDHLDRVRGSRHIFHVRSENATNANLRHVVVIQRTFDGLCRISVRQYPTELLETPVHVIVPYSNRPQRFSWFLNQFETLVSDGKARARLILSVCNTSSSDVKWVRNITGISPASDKIEVIETQGDSTGFFSRAIAIREAAKKVSEDGIMFISDVDMHIFAMMFDSCRFNAIQGSQAYFPVFYSLYARNERIAKSGGYWRESSLGMSCMYRSDFDALAAYDDAERKFVGWGMEDRALSEAFKKHPAYEVFRAVEPSLRHKWHLKHCEPLTPSYEDCLAVTFEQLGDMKSVGRFLLDYHFDTQKFFAKFAEYEDETYGSVIKDDTKGTADAAELERRRLRKEMLQKKKERERQEAIEEEKKLETEWRLKTGITEEKEEEMLRKEMEEGKALEMADGGAEKDDDDDKEEIEKDKLLLKDAKNRAESEKREMQQMLDLASEAERAAHE